MKHILRHDIRDYEKFVTIYWLEEDSRLRVGSQCLPGSWSTCPRSTSIPNIVQNGRVNQLILYICSFYVGNLPLVLVEKHRERKQIKNVWKKYILCLLCSLNYQLYWIIIILSISLTVHDLIFQNVEYLNFCFGNLSTQTLFRPCSRKL